MSNLLKRKLGGLIWSFLDFNSRVDTHLGMSALDIAVDSVIGKQLNGDYFEFGVYKGDSLSRVYNRFASKDGLNDRKFIAFDSFEGLPSSEELCKPVQYSESAYSAGEELFLKNIRKKGVDINKVITVKGYYNESLERFSEKNCGVDKIALAYIDCDLYMSAVEVLNFITPYLQLGTILVVDDWFAHTGTPKSGIQKAFKE